MSSRVRMWRRGRAGQPVLDPGLALDEPAAGVAAVDVGPGALGLPGGSWPSTRALTREPRCLSRRPAASGRAAGARVAHPAGRGARWASALRSMARPRWIRERTVPSLASRTSAISSYDRPSMSQSTTAARKSGGRAARALSTSASKDRSATPVGGATGLSRAARSSASASKRIRGLRRAWSRNRLVVIRCSQPSKVPGCRCQAAEDPDEDLLGQVLGVGAVPGQPVGQPIDPAEWRSTSSSQVGTPSVVCTASWGGRLCVPRHLPGLPA